ncbi:GntR family transcriptional regulator [Chitinophaga sp.]|uniref:GntR family transcriptional regulator n=1 Tax=Chitinophaga sp. TaxID=1869181 RepID=UPI002C807320|nr:GntR family transcriptional regulator [Chitinophaga sp.]HWV65772.1 GntR family transcriptional regulator [Chitinophaga sp.]
MKPVISLDHSSDAPKYQQIIQFIINAIETNQLKIGDKLPSVNQVCENTGIAPKTVMQAFRSLTQSGIISAVRYKGFFVASTNTQSTHNIFVLFNSLTAYKEEIYESIKDTIAGKGTVSIYFHHNNVALFNTLLAQSNGKYTAYIIMPIRDKGIASSLMQLPQHKIYILDLGYRDWGTRYPSVCQYFREDIYGVLRQHLTKIRRKYNKLVLVTGPGFYNLTQIESGFRLFCRESGIRSAVITHVDNKPLTPGELYILVHDGDLVHLVKRISALSLKLGKDIGIISYNDIPIKEIAANGIATISTDFTKMGADIINMVLHKKKMHIKNPCKLVERPSF